MKQKIRYLLPFVALLAVMAAAFFVNTPAFAQDELPPAEPPAAPAEAPGEQPAPSDPAEEPQAAALALGSTEGDPLPLAEEGGPSILANQACYTVGGSESCFASVTLALNNITATNTLPSDRKIYLENGSLAGFTLNGTASILSQINGVIGAGTDAFDPLKRTTVTSNINVANVGSFTLQGMIVNAQIDISNAAGKVVVKDVDVKATGDGIEISGASSVEVSDVDSSNNTGAGMIIGGNSGGVLIQRSAFSKNGTSGLVVNALGAITVNQVSVTENTGQGITLGNLGGQGAVSLTSVTVSNNDSGGLSIGANGNITLRRVSANLNNLGSGAVLTNVSASPVADVLIESSEFNGNDNTGLVISASGVVTLNNVSANGNKTIVGARGAFITNTIGTKGVSILDKLGPNNFNDNYAGLEVLSKGAIAVNGVTVSNNGGFGMLLNNASGAGAVTVNRGIFHDNGGDGMNLQSARAVTARNISAIDNSSFGAFIVNNYSPTGAYAVSVTQGTFNANTLGGLQVVSRGAVTLDSIIANDQVGTGPYSDGYGVKITNDIGTANPGVTLKSTFSANSFSNNNTWGLDIQTFGVVSIVNSAFSDNDGGDGLTVLNESSPVNPAVTLKNVTASGNVESGIYILSRGAITLNRVIAADNDGFIGTMLFNNYDAIKAPAVSVSQSSFNGNIGTGIRVDSYGKITLNAMTATSNGYDGVIIHSTGTKSSLTFTASSGPSVLSGNGYNGMYIDGVGGPLTFRGVVFDSNGVDGVSAPSANPVNGNVTLVDVRASGNGADGINLAATGSISIDRVQAFSNADDGVMLDNTLSPAGDKKSISAKRSIASGNQNYGFGFYSNFTVTLSGLEAHNNGSNGIYVDADGGTGKVTVNSGSGQNIATYNGDKGVDIQAAAPVSVTGLTSTFNNNDGLEITTTTEPGDVILSKLTLQFNAVGLRVIARGKITLDQVYANDNFSGAGANLVNNSTTDPMDVSIQRSTFNNNIVGSGLSVNSRGNILLNGVTAVGNLGSGATLNNSTGSGTVTIASSKGSNRFNDNGANGVFINASGPVSLSKVMVSGNGVSNFSGVRVTGSQPVTVTCGIFNGNGKSGIETTIGANPLTLKGVTILGNDTFGGAADANIAPGTAIVTILPYSCGTW